MAAIVLAAAGVVIFDAPARATVTGHSVAISGNAFHSDATCEHPAGSPDIAVNAGDTVKWSNCDDVLHDVTFKNGGFAKQTVPPGTTTEPLTFDVAGTFDYECSIHHFDGSVMVSESTTTPTEPTTTVTTQAATTTTKQTTTSTSVAPTSTTEDISGIFTGEPSTEPTTTVFSTDTTRALGSGGDSGTSAGAVAGLILGLGAIGTAVALVVRRMRGATPPS